MVAFLTDYWRALVVAGGFAFLIWLTWWVGRPRLKKKDAPQAKKVMEPPQTDLLFLAECGFGAEKARELWGFIRGSNGDEDYYTVLMYASMKYTKWYLRLTKTEKRSFEWENLWSELKSFVEKDPDYWVHLPKLQDFVFRVRSYTG